MAADIIGNRSVHWRIRHTTANGQPKNVKHGTGDTPANDEVVTGRGFADGKDSIDYGEIGTKLGHKGSFLITLRYKTMADAEAAGGWIAQNVRPGPGGFLLSLTVPAINRENPDADQPPEIRVDW
jgi:hypothetical protein